MKFDYILGNPPYQQDSVGANESDTPLYHYFYDGAMELSDKVMLIHPARFLFNAGATPKAWNEKMLSDPHLKVIRYDENSEDVFPNTSIRGGVAITYHDTSKDYGPVGMFSPYPELNSIKQKVEYFKEPSLSDVVTNRGLYRYSDLAYAEQPEELAKTADPRIAPSCFERMPSLFTDDEPQDGNEYVRIYGIISGNRCYKWFRKDYIKYVENLDMYKVLVPKAGSNISINSNADTTVLGMPVIVNPSVGFTETFISVGQTDSLEEAEATLKYIKTKFVRTLISILKVTQNNAKPVWKYVPMQDFTPSSDIDWSASIPDIDAQLYRKYGLDQSEIDFIESHVKPME